MKAIVKYEQNAGNIKLMDIPEPFPGRGQVKIKVMAAGVCGTDLLIWKGIHKTNLPLVLGHEVSGIVVEVGEGVENVKVGDRVTTETTLATCETCDYCVNKEYNLCSNRKGIGTQVNGGFAEYVITRQESIHILPENVDFISAALTEPLACGVHAVMEKSRVKENDLVVVFGPGAIGLLTAQVAKAVGAKVIVVGISKDKRRLELAEKLGIDYAVNSQETDLKSLVMDLSKGYGADVTFECAGSQKAISQGLEILRKKGQFVQMGLLEDPSAIFNTDYIVHRELEIIGSRSQKPSSWPKALKLLSEKKVNTRKLVTKILPLEEWENAFESSLNGEEVKIVLYAGQKPE